jgi:Protein of unknown function (DUF3237)
MSDEASRWRLSSQCKATILAAFLLAAVTNQMNASAADATASFETPTVEHVMTVKATIDAPIEMGKTPQGQRRVIVISGGTFEGPGIKGTIMPGGEDWQLVREDGVTQLEARYWLRTDDGAVIRVLNQVLTTPPAQGVADAKRYVRSSVQFEAPTGKYDWLNKAVFVGTLVADATQRPPVVTLRFFKVN